MENRIAREKRKSHLSPAFLVLIGVLIAALLLAGTAAWQGWRSRFPLNIEKGYPQRIDVGVRGEDGGGYTFYTLEDDGCYEQIVEMLNGFRYDRTEPYDVMTTPSLPVKYALNLYAEADFLPLDDGQPDCIRCSIAPGVLYLDGEDQWYVNYKYPLRPLTELLERKLEDTQPGAAKTE